MLFLSAFLSIAMLAATLPSDTGHRKVMLVARDLADDNLIVQQDYFNQDKPGLKEREIVIRVITAASDPATYKSFHRDGDGFLFLLYGKDGGEKFRASSPVTLRKLYGIIDSMPMRQQEMKQKNGGG